MKHFLFIICLFFTTPLFSQADSTTVFTVAIDENSAAYNKIGTRFFFTKMNVLYIGVENPIEISVPGFSSKEITAQISSGGTIKKQDDGSFTATISKIGRGIIIVKAKGKEVSRHKFRAKRVPDPGISLNGKFFGGNILKGTLKQATGLVPLLEDFDFPFQYRVTSFKMVVYSNNKFKTLGATGPMLTQEMKAAISNSNSGDLILFDDIRLVGADGIPRLVGAMSFPVIE